MGISEARVTPPYRIRPWARLSRKRHEAFWILNHYAQGPAERRPVARKLGETSLMFFVHPTLTEAELSTTAKVAMEVLRAASGS